MNSDSFLSQESRLLKSNGMSQSQNWPLNRFNTAVSLQASSLQQCRKVIHTLQRSLKQQKQKRQQLQESLVQFQKRTFQRQTQFRSVLAKLDTNVSKHNFNQPNLEGLYHEVLDKFGQGQQKVRQNLEQRYKENLGIMQRRVKQITNTMEMQLKKAYKLSQGEHVQLRVHIERLQNVAMQIDEKNVQLMKDKQTLYFKVRVLKQQKQLLIQELNQKKKMVRKYFQIAKQSSLIQDRTSGLEGAINSTSRTASLANKDRNKQTICHEQSFAYELIKSKLDSKQGLSSKRMSSFNNSFNLLTSKKQEVSAMTLRITNPNNKRIPATQSSRMKPSSKGQDHSNGLTIGMNMKQSLSRKEPRVRASSMFISQSRPQNEQTCNTAQANTINSLKQVIGRQRQKKVSYQGKLTQAQQKIVLIDKIVVHALSKLNNLEQVHRINSSFNRKQPDRSKIPNTHNTGQFQKVFERIKNVISGNAELVDLLGSQTNANSQTRHRNSNVGELLGLLNSNEE